MLAQLLEDAVAGVVEIGVSVGADDAQLRPIVLGAADRGHGADQLVFHGNAAVDEGNDHFVAAGHDHDAQVDFLERDGPAAADRHALAGNFVLLFGRLGGRAEGLRVVNADLDLVAGPRLHLLEQVHEIDPRLDEGLRHVRANEGLDDDLVFRLQFFQQLLGPGGEGRELFVSDVGPQPAIAGEEDRQSDGHSH